LHLVGCIRNYITMHGLMNVKLTDKHVLCGASTYSCTVNFFHPK